MRGIQEGFFISSFNQRCWYLQHKGTLGIDNEESIFLFSVMKLLDSCDLAVLLDR